MRSGVRAAVVAGLATAVLATLTACGPAHIEVKSFAGLPDNTKGIDTSASDAKPSAAWQGDGTQLAIVTWGPTSCLPYVNTINMGGGNGLTVDLNGGDCSGSDVGPRTVIINVPPESNRYAPLNLTLRPQGIPVTVPPFADAATPTP